ncbi:signal peptidase I [Candidatus Woesearchaeota archaeon]|nr:signal peptidase I [Candidatus Woesearchaeota archaeon]
MFFKKKKYHPRPKSTWGKIWYFIWYDDSIASWIVNFALAFILIRFIVYPGLGLLLSTSFPIVAVVSNSMEHPGGFEEWWQSPADLSECGSFCTQAQWYEKQGISYEDFRTYPFKNGFNKGDIMVLFGTSPEKIKIGEVIVFWSGKQYPIIHRVIHIREDNNQVFFETKGDFNRFQIYDPGNDLDEQNIPESKYLGKAVMRVPLLGYIKIWFTDLVNLIR